VDRQGAVSPGPQERHQAEQEHVAQRQQDRKPQRNDVAGRETEHDRQDVRPIGDRVKDLASLLLWLSVRAR
jgi:hypothetical protein